MTWVLAFCRAKKPGDARSLTQQKPLSRYPTNIMGSSPQIVGNIVLFWSLLWKHPRRSFTWLENMSTHTKVLAINCAQRESVCVRTRTYARVYAHSHILPSAQWLSTSPRWLPAGSCLLHIDLLQTSCPCWGLRHSNALQKGDGIVNTHSDGQSPPSQQLSF